MMTGLMAMRNPWIQGSRKKPTMVVSRMKLSGASAIIQTVSRVSADTSASSAMVSMLPR